ncbi:MAG: hypothetical protein CHACPFDD_03030 [Phycisphaerae bacterium]|nr:hypothetical protein [Phycisphaerae bacterium]
MLLHALRALFFLLVAAVALSAGGSSDVPGEVTNLRVPLTIAGLGMALVVVAVDVFLPRKSLAALSGGFLGLVVGMVIAYGLSLIIDLLVQTYAPSLLDKVKIESAEGTKFVPSSGETVVSALKLILGIICCYLTITLILQTKDDIRFVIPYVEFAKQSKGARPLILDTSVIIDGRIADVCDTRIVDAPIIIPRFILQELQAIADSSDKLKRNRGRRGLDMLNKLQTNDKIEIKISDARLTTMEEGEAVDEKLVTLAKKLDGRLVTNDYNLNKIAQLRGVDVININDLANALKPVLLHGENITVKIIKPGEEPGQGIGYLEDGTMIVAENCRDKINEDVVLTVTNVLQTSAGRMVFGRPEGSVPVLGPRRPRPRVTPG